ncbi:MAG TPA: hypothetical protein VEL06_15155, partial [Haliangiales bacterium]|nr:hypothetical protein [Haliangiales bacterium]
MNPRFYPALRRRLALFLLSGILPLTVFAQNVSVNWAGGNSGRSWLGATNWNPQIVPLNGGGTNFTVIVPDSSSLVYDSSSAGTIDAFSLGNSSLLTANGGGGLVVTGPTILRGGVAANGSGSAFSATSIQTAFSGTPYLIATSGGRIGVAASTYTWPYYNGSFTLLNCNGNGSRIDLPNLTSFAVSYGDNGSWTYSVMARSNGVIDLSNLTQVTGGSQDDWLEFNMDATGDILLDNLGRTTGQVRFNSSRPFYELPVLRTATGSFIAGANSLFSLPALLALSSGAISVGSNGSVVAPQLLTLDAVAVSLGTNASVIATNLSAYRNSDISFAPGRDFQYGLLTDVYASRISAIGGATGRIDALSYDTPADWRWSPTLFSADGAGSLLDCSSMTSLRVRYGAYSGYNYYFTAKNGGVVDFSSVQTIIGPEEGDDWINMTVSNGGTVRLPNLQQIVRQMILNVQVPLYTLPALTSANGTVLYIGTGNRLDLPQLRSFTSGGIGWGFNSTLYAPNLLDVSYSAISLAPGNNLLAPPPTNVFASRLSVSGGSTFTVAASSYDTPS